jgi:hypothetical protein
MGSGLIEKEDREKQTLRAEHIAALYEARRKGMK